MSKIENRAKSLICKVAFRKATSRKTKGNYALAKSLILLVALVAFQVAFQPRQLVAVDPSPPKGRVNATNLAQPIDRAEVFR